MLQNVRDRGLHLQQPLRFSALRSVETSDVTCCYRSRNEEATKNSLLVSFSAFAHKLCFAEMRRVLIVTQASVYCVVATALLRAVLQNATGTLAVSSFSLSQQARTTFRAPVKAKVLCCKPWLRARPLFPSFQKFKVRLPPSKKIHYPHYRQLVQLILSPTRRRRTI